LYHYIQKCGVEVVVKRNDELQLAEMDAYDKLVLSPGPGLPSETTLMFDCIEKYANSKPILGVCLGMQGIANYYGGELINQAKVKHGVEALVNIDTTSPLFKNLDEQITVGLYHSWCVDEQTLPSDFKVIGKSAEQVVMAIEHKKLPIYGVQFHPESIMTPNGLQIIANFLAIQ